MRRVLKIKQQVFQPVKPAPLNLEPLRQMTIDLGAIYHLANSRDLDAIRQAILMARRVEYNQIIKTLSDLEREVINK